MICGYCGRSCGTALEGRAKWVRKFGVVGNVPICEACSRSCQPERDAATTRPALAHKLSTGGWWACCPNCATSVILSNMRGTCRRCSTMVYGNTEPRCKGQPDPDFTKRREMELAESRQKYEEKMIEKARGQGGVLREWSDGTVCWELRSDGLIYYGSLCYERAGWDVSYNTVKTLDAMVARGELAGRSLPKLIPE